jgi:hypothetical protein
MRYLLPLLLLLSSAVLFLPGCEPKEDLLQTSGRLELAADTVLFDTVFTTIGTVTKRLWVYNRNPGAVKTDISLAGTQGQTYSLVINGDAGPAANGVTIRGNDSLLILVKARLGDNGSSAAPKDFLVVDQVKFRTNGNEQDVKLVAYGQNAYFHRADIISTDTTWPTDKPHVIINALFVQGTNRFDLGVLVLPNVTLRIPKGARIYSHAGASIIVQGRLLVNDLTEPNAFVPTDTVHLNNPNIVRFSGDRLESVYNEVPGQWAGIQFYPGSRGNRIRYAEIKNAVFGVSLFNPENEAVRPSLTLDNTVIKNVSGSNPSYVNNGNVPGGIVSLSGDVTATNCLLTNCGEYAVLSVGGGTQSFNFCTFANYTPAFHRETASLYFTNELATDPQVKLPLTLSLTNSIVWGSIEDELLLKNYPDYSATLTVKNNLLRTKQYQTTAAVIGAAGVNLVNQNPKFERSPENAVNRFNYLLDSSSPALDRPAPAGTAVPPNDLRNLPRNLVRPDVGAYELQ